MNRAYRIAINGYGRIGQSLLRTLYTNGKYRNLRVVAINELTDLDTLTYLTRYDTTHGRFPVPVENDGKQLLINGDPIQVLNESNPQNLPWAELKVDLILECTGSFTDRKTAEQHLNSGAKRLLFSQPADEEIDATVVYGFNTDELKASQQVISCASCTTNCIIPVLDLLDRKFGIEYGVTTTIHSAMNDQPIIDSYHHTDLRLTRSAIQSLVPVDTALNQGIAKILPHLTDRFECLHLRVPTINVSLMDIAINVRDRADAAAVNAVFRDAAQGGLKGLLGYTEEAHASIDFNTDPRSAIVDGTQTRVSGDKLIKMMVWFDNEWGYANRMLDVARHWLSLKES